MAPVNALQQLTGLLADDPWVPMATVHFTAMTGALFAGWMAVRAKGHCLFNKCRVNATDLS
jgi:hypothetical protein